MATLSIVTPSFNQAGFIREALDSVSAIETQHEHLVMDAGSTDGTREILEGRDDPDLTWVSEPDRGQTHAVNKGLQRASGGYVGWINADDAYVSPAVDRAIAHLEARPQTAAIYGFLEIVDEQGAAVRTYTPAPFSWRRYLLLGDYVPTPTIIFRRSLVEERGMLDEYFRDAADYDFYLRLLHGVRVDRLGEPLVRFRYHEASKTASTLDVQLDEALEIRQRWARSASLALAMRTLDRAKRGLYEVVSPWPPGTNVSRVADAAYRVRERIAGR